MAPRDGIQVHLDDLVLRIAPLDLDGRQDFAQLPDGCPLETNLLVQVTCQLHREGGGPAHPAAADDRIPEGGKKSPNVHSPVTEKPAVLDGYQRVFHDVRNFITG